MATKWKMRDVRRIQRRNGSSTRRETDHTKRNAQNQQTGAWFQSVLDGYHEELKLRKLATVHRTQPETKILDYPNAIVCGKGPVDYMAFLPGGKTIHFDAKSRADDFTVGNDMDHQEDWLRDMAAMGHIAGLLIWWHKWGECRWHPVSSFDRRVRRLDGIPINGFQWLDLFR